MPIKTSRAMLLCLLASAAVPIPVAQAASRIEDLGRTDPTTLVTATLWLRPHDQAAFEAGIANRTGKGSPDYHRWMTQAEAGAASPSAEEVGLLVQSLRAAGLAGSS